MNRRNFIATLLASPLAGRPAAAADGRYEFELVDGGPSGDGWLAGIRVLLDPGWKTYWRMPGDSGIPPEFDWRASRGANNIEVLYPLPSRIRDEGGETVGYADEVIFPIRFVPAATGARLSLSVTLGICSEICIPVSTASAIDIGAAGTSSPQAALVARWLEKVPLMGEPVRKAWAEAPDLLAIDLAEPATDIFVEGPESAYFHAPVFSADRRQARLDVAGLSSARPLKGASLRVTVALEAGGLEQWVVVG